MQPLPRILLAFLLSLAPGLVMGGVATALPSPAMGTATLANPAGNQEAETRRELRQLEKTTALMRSSGKASGKDWRAAVRQIKELSDGGLARATWWLLEDARLGGDAFRRSRISARRKLWGTFLENAEQDPWVARSHTLDEFVTEAEHLGHDWILKQLEDLARNTSHLEVRAASQIHQAAVLFPLDPRGRKLSPSDRREAEELLDTVAAHGGEWGEAARRARWRIEHLRVGQTAPDFSAFDVHGNEIRLEDGRGKVCLLHFFGFGSPTIEQSMNRDRALIQKHWDHRFWLIGINEDQFRNRYMETLERHRVEWDVAWEGEVPRNETIATTWRLEPREHTLVLDARGVIRAVDPTDDQLEQILDELIEETHTEAAERKRSKGAEEHQQPGDTPPPAGGRSRDPSRERR